MPTTETPTAPPSPAGRGRIGSSAGKKLARQSCRGGADGGSLSQRERARVRENAPRSCGVRTGGNRLIKFHVRRWCCYGLVKVEATGSTF